MYTHDPERYMFKFESNHCFNLNCCIESMHMVSTKVFDLTVLVLLEEC